MSGWGKIPENVQNITSCKDCGHGTMPENLSVLLAANEAVSGMNIGTNGYASTAPSSPKGERAR